MIEEFLTINSRNSNKKEWLLGGKKVLEDIANLLGAKSKIRMNKSGSIDRGYINGFIAKNNKIVYVSINDGMKNILYRKASYLEDYIGGTNNIEKISILGFKNLISWLRKYFNE